MRNPERGHLARRRLRRKTLIDFKVDRRFSREEHASGQGCPRSGWRAPMKKRQTKGWHSRGYLSHFDGGEIVQSITFHLGDALPNSVIEGWKLELETIGDDELQIELSRRIENYLDRGYGDCHLRKNSIAKIVENSLMHFDGDRYKMISWVIMPNHVHLLLKPGENKSLSKIVHSIKSFTAQKANRVLARQGRFWQEDYFDRYIRNYDHFQSAIKYIENNPVKAGLCKTKSDWRFSSASRPT